MRCSELVSSYSELGTRKNVEVVTVTRVLTYLIKMLVFQPGRSLSLSLPGVQGKILGFTLKMIIFK